MPACVCVCVRVRVGLGRQSQNLDLASVTRSMTMKVLGQKSLNAVHSIL
jgi:hypothetical protein